MQRLRRPKISSDKLYVLRVAIIYAIINLYPLYSFVSSEMSISDTYIRLALIASSIVWFFGVIKANPVPLIIYYVFNGLVLNILMPIERPYVMMTLIYSLLAIHTDFIVKYVAGLGTRKHHIRIPYLVLTVVLFIVLAGMFILSSIGISMMLNNYIESIVSSSVNIFKVFFQEIIMTRIGSITLFFIIMGLLYILLNDYIVSLISDLILLNPKFVEERIRNIVSYEAQQLLAGKDPIVNLYKRSSLFIIGLLIFVGLAPLYNIYIKFFNNEWYGYAISFVVWSVLSWGVYRAFTSYIEGALVRVKITDPIEEAKKLAYGRMGLIISSILLIGFVVLVIYIHGNVILMFERALLAPISSHMPPSTTLPYLYMNKIYNYVNLFSNTLVKYMYSYVEQVGQMYLKLMNLIKYLINIFWG
ncbi:MAG: hypothetical protein GXO43_05780 [Crenarchaeota archaeon]|nr:hypothetical protein [Thermoproteota archaeon]